ncbi:odorant receptor 49b-like [Andrena cerasifolii]|uniref:odorant receptor 49b-like n=1 Tax=Andrena cerasifolii TaxID=2819439 RepID=UPI004037F45C
MKVTTNMATAVTLIVIQLFYVGCGNYTGQILLDNGNELFTKTYFSRWHESPLPLQKMLLYIRLRSMQPTGLMIGGLFTFSFEFFSKLMNVSMSYFTVLYSTI